MQEISFNFDGKNPKKINGDIRYQIDTISLLKKNKFKIFLGYKNVTFFFSLCLRCFGLILIKIPILSQIFNKKLNYLCRQKYLDFKKQTKIIFSHYHYIKPKKKSYLIWSTQGLMKSKYYKEYKNLFSLKSDISLYRKLDNNKNIIFLIWDKRFGLRTKKLCKLRSPIKIVEPTLNINEIENKKISVAVNKKINILFIGKNPKIKGYQYLIQALKKLEKENNNFEANIISNFTPKEKFKNIRHYSNIKDNLKKKLLKKCDIFILPTLAETFGYSLMEAISYKCLIITCNYYPLTKFCKNNYNGYLVKTKNSDDIYKKLKKILKNKKKIKRFKENSYKIYKHQFSQIQFLKKLSNIIQEVNQNNIKSDI